MIHLDIVKVAVPLKQKFAIAGGEAEIKTNLLTILNNRYNGEASGSVKYGPSVDEMYADLMVGCEMLNKLGTLDMNAMEAIDKSDLHPTARSALIAAILNYLSGESKRYPWEILELGTPIGIQSSMTIGIDSPVDMLEMIRNSQYPVVKVKMGNEEDVMLLDGLSNIKDKEIRVDANGGWSCAKAEEMVFQLSRFGIRIIEQPTSIDYVQEWQHLKGKNKDIEFVLDEGLNTLEDYEKIGEYCDVVNVKMEKCGGILEGVRIAKRAHTDGKKVLLGCMVESSIGIAQSVYMSSQADYFDLDGPLLLKDDIAHGIRYDKESIEVDREIIGGPKLLREVVEKYIKE